MLSCSLFYSIYGLFANTGGIVISCDSGVLKCYAGHEIRQKIGGKEKWGMGEGEEKEEKWRKYLHGWHETEFFACLIVSNILGKCAHVSF